ncbi:N-acetylmuramoyl-L-alanine amidase [bacterium]|nr:N-acetylmuramoyl-L-alanine amidase [bacterium]
MASNYAPNQFFRQAKISLLRDYFTRRKMLEDMEWDNLKETETKPIYDAWQVLPEQTREEMEFEFRQVHDMATANGAWAIIEEGRFHVLDLTADLDSQDGYINKALWTLLAHPDVFDIAQKLNRADNLNGRHWRKRKDVPKMAPDVSGEVLKELADAISAYYREKQGRGRHCWAETYLRGGRYHYFFVYPQDYMNSKSLGICVVGNFDLAPPGLEVMRFLADIVRRKVAEYDIPVNAVLGHREVGAMAGYDWKKGQYKSCPGKYFRMDLLREMVGAQIINAI